MAAERGCAAVVCGHIHAANKRLYQVPRGDATVDILYLNSGDWVESCTALVEHMDGRFEIIEWTKNEVPLPLPVQTLELQPV